MCLIKNRNNRNNIRNLLVQFQFTGLSRDRVIWYCDRDIELLFCFHSLSRDYPNYTFIISALFFFFHKAIRSVQNSRTEWWWRMRKGVDMYVYVFRSWWECTNDIQIYFCKSLSSLAQYKDSSNQNINDISGRRESPSKKDMKTKYFFHGQNERVIFTFQCGVSKHTVST